MSELRKLIAAIEAGNDWPPTDVLWKRMGLGEGYQVGRAFHGSLDAAKALHDALLPGWDWNIGWTQGRRLTIACIWPVEAEWEDITIEHDVVSRAWLIAILKAYEAQR